MALFSSSRVRLTSIIAASMLAGGLMTGTAMAVQGHMLAARGDLQRAESQLQSALPDKAGHRANALNLVSQAIGEVNAGLAAGSY